MRCVLALVLSSSAFSATACGGGDDIATDGGAADGSVDGGLAVAPPDIPWLAEGVPFTMTPCPAGWREVSDEDGLTTCDAYPEGGPTECAFGEAHFPGEPGCRPIGDPCPAGEWPKGLPSDESTVVFVDAGATGGDGSRATPFGALSDVPWSLRGSGWTIALAKGTHAGTLPLRAGVRVVGACVAETILTGLEGPALAVVTSTTAIGEPPVLRNVSIVEPPQIGVVVGDGPNVVLEGVLVERALAIGIGAINGSVVRATDLVVAHTRAESSSSNGNGVELANGGRFEATRVVVLESRVLGIHAYGAESTAVLDDAAVHRTQPRESDDRGGTGIQLDTGARLEATRVVISENNEGGVLSLSGATATLLDAIVRDTDSPIGGGLGNGLVVEDGSQLTATRTVVSGNRAWGVFASEKGATVTLTDVAVRDTRAQESDGRFGSGLAVRFGARLDATRIVLSRNVTVGLAGEGPGTAIRLHDAVIRDTQPRPTDGLLGRGANLQDGALFEADRLLVSGNHNVGIFAALPGTTVTLTDVVVRDMLPDGEGLGGAALYAQFGAHVVATRMVTTNTRETGIVSIGEGVFEGRDVTVENVLRSDASGDVGYGVNAIGGTLRLVGFNVRDTGTCGLFVHAVADMVTALDVESGIVERSPIGACVQVDGYDLGRLSRNVVYRDNGTNLEATMLPLPSPLL